MSEDNTAPRDTQFLGFAKRLWDAMPDAPEDYHDVAAYDKWSDECERFIACYAYDLVKYVLHMVPHLLQAADQAQTVEEVIQHVPDPTALPDGSW